jgi:hypothetical protein
VSTTEDVFAGFSECPTIRDLSYRYDCGDERSEGALEVTFILGDKKFDSKLFIGSDSAIEDCNVRVNGEPVELLDTHVWPQNYVAVPHFNAGVKACTRWEQRANETLLEDFQKWVNDEWEAVREQGLVS